MLDVLHTVVSFIESSLTKIILSGIIIILGMIIYKIIKKTIKSRIIKSHIRKQDGFLIVKMTKSITIIGCILTFIFIWEGNIQNFWIGITSIFGIVAIGFFAVWSILSNIVSGIVIILLKSIRIGDQIEVMGEGIQGRIENVTLFHVVLIDKKKNNIAIPNNLFIQKIIKVIN